MAAAAVDKRLNRKQQYPRQDFSRELDPNQFLLDRVSVQKTEPYIGGKHRLRSAVTVTLGFEPEQSPLG
jgi:hypothetical protein